MKTVLFETEEPRPRRGASKRHHGTTPRGSPEQTASAGGREYNKAVKREKIKAAARALFTEMDYEKATVRAIAARAGVALGTLSLYTEDKRDMILLVYNDDVEAMIARGVSLLDQGASFDDNLITFFRVFYEGYAGNLQLARTYLQINFFAYGINAKGLALNRQRKLEAMTKIVKQGQARGELRKDVKPGVVAMQFLFLHSSAVRSWILDAEPAVEVGLAEMRDLINLQTQGLDPAHRR